MILTPFKKIATIFITITTLAAIASAAVAAQSLKPVLDQLKPEDSVLLLVDYQPQYAFATQSRSIDSLMNNAVALAKTAQAFNVPTIITTVTAKAYGGPTFPQIQKAAHGAKIIDRKSINAWQDQNVVDAIRKTGRKKILIAGLWTDNCVMLPALYALKEGYEVYVVANASADLDTESHEVAMQRLIQAGAVPITWLVALLEWQADWTKDVTNGAVYKILDEHAAAMGVGAFYKRFLQENK